MDSISKAMCAGMLLLHSHVLDLGVDEYNVGKCLEEKQYVLFY